MTATIHRFPCKPRVVSLDAGKAFLVRWVDVEGYKHRGVVRGVQDAGQARTAVGMFHDNFYEFLGDAEEVKNV